MKKMLALVAILAVLLAVMPAVAEAKSKPDRGPLIGDALYGSVINN